MSTILTTARKVMSSCATYLYSRIYIVYATIKGYIKAQLHGACSWFLTTDSAACEKVAARLEQEACHCTHLGKT